MATTKKKRRRGPNARTRCPLLALGKRERGSRGWKIVNGTTTLLFTITPEHIRKGVAGDDERCPVALALIAAFGDQYRYSVGAAIVKLIDDENRVFVRLATPPALSAQIKKWDRRGGATVGVWKLKPGPQLLHPLPKSWLDGYSAGAAARRQKQEEKRAASKRASGARVTIKPGLPGGKIATRKRRRRSPTRIVGRITRLAA